MTNVPKSEGAGLRPISAKELEQALAHLDGDQDGMADLLLSLGHRYGARSVWLAFVGLYSSCLLAKSGRPKLNASRRHLTEIEVRDPLLAEWGDWMQHDGGGVPHDLCGRTVLVSGPDGRTRQVELTLTYVASDEASAWKCTAANGEPVIRRYRVRRHERLAFDPDALHLLDRARGFMALNGSRPLLIGLDGVAE